MPLNRLALFIQQDQDIRVAEAGEGLLDADPPTSKTHVAQRVWLVPAGETAQGEEGLESGQAFSVVGPGAHIVEQRIQHPAFRIAAKIEHDAASFPIGWTVMKAESASRWVAESPRGYPSCT